MIKKLLICVLLTTGLCLAVVSMKPTKALAVYNPFDKICSEGGKDSAACNTAAQDPTAGIIYRAVMIISFVTGVTAVFAMIFAGTSYVLANGDSTKAAKAKDVMLYSAIGLAIALSAGAIARTIAGKFV